jgi:type I restriction enzyme R subunit
MTTPSFREDDISQIPALQTLIKLGYIYLSPAEAIQARGGKDESSVVSQKKLQMK